MESDIPYNVKFDYIQKLLRGVNEMQITDTPLNDYAFVFLQGHQKALDDVMNLLRREL